MRESCAHLDLEYDPKNPFYMDIYYIPLMCFIESFLYIISIWTIDMEYLLNPFNTTDMLYIIVMQMH